MQQGGGSQSQHAEMTPATTTVGQQPVESASPISSRPPSNMDELIKLSSGGGDEDTEGDRAGGLASGNRWPRQETLALLKIRSDMDAGFRDATIKGPLWEDVSRNLAELGYKRSAKKCKEKFENVHKYYKRTKEGRAGRQDGKSYKFFSLLEALHTTTAATSNVSASISLPVTTVTTTTTTTNTITSDVAPVSIGIPIPISSPIRIPPPSSTIAPMSSPTVPPNLSASATISPTLNVLGSSTTTPQPSLPPPTATATTTTTPFRITFSSDSSSSAETEDDDDDEDDTDFQGQPSTTPGSSHKRKRQSFSNTNRMMVFFESLMKQVMQKQESMQQRFLEVIEKREQERMIREEAWKRKEMARSAREHELMAQERAISASRDAAIISFLQKITGQAIQLPPAAPPPPPPASAPAPVVVASAIPVQTPTLSHAPLSIPQEQRDQQPQRRYQYQQLQQVHQSQHAEALRHQPSSTSLPSSEVVIAIPEQQVLPQPQEIGGSGSFESTSSRWPKVEVLALIKLRSGLEPRYQEAGPKGPLWEEISAGMQRMGYKRSAKRCKEKWENINKYFKKVKESNKKRPEDAKTCPYFHELDALYRKKIICSSSGTSSFSSQNRVEEPQQESVKLGSPSNPLESSNVPPIMPPPRVTERPEDKESIGNVGAQASNIGLESSLFEEGNGRSSKKPEGIVKELRNQQEMQQQQRAQSIVDGFDKYRYSEKMEHQEDDEDDEYDNEEDEDEDEDEDLEERKMSYKVEFQRQNANASNGGGNGTPSFMAVVQ